MRAVASGMPGRLFVCATPIGNLQDVTLRLLTTLSEVDAIAAEDTRRTRKLLTAHGVHARLISYHEANEVVRTPELIGRLRRGQRIALVADAGMPAVSDPGWRLVRGAIDAGIPIEVVPGPSAVLAALVASGLPTARFAFEGFLPRKAGDRRRRLATIAGDDRTVVFFEAPERLAATLVDLAEALGPRRAAVARELTKVHEEVLRGTLPELVAVLEGTEVRGEVAVVVEGRPEEPRDLEAAVEMARELMTQGQRPGPAASEAAAAHGLRRTDVYNRLGPSPTPEARGR